ncbi:hypothetical protein K457DRAFT_143592 [Linnemannia elongata AG-77]|uniref:Uncharacterized protein n=1 Tax=Linnemannia elongata AG-77 TaxID=1314771 RepID=A0A197JAK5_9FUNG|nr:hypothetical protein K457DRAFT_143592 [Linnemannia elongata AG-77]
MAWEEDSVTTHDCGCVSSNWSDDWFRHETRWNSRCDEHQAKVDHNTKVGGRQHQIYDHLSSKEKLGIIAIENAMVGMEVQFTPISYRKLPVDKRSRDRLLIHKYIGRYYCCKNRAEFFNSAYDKLIVSMDAERAAYIKSMGWTSDDLRYKQVRSDGDF